MGLFLLLGCRDRELCYVEPCPASWLHMESTLPFYMLYKTRLLKLVETHTNSLSKPSKFEICTLHCRDSRD